tara:strand:+ start:209 stop:580 length:372 start_codon:yes stop_codon:yes gene_type:complete
MLKKLFILGILFMLFDFCYIQIVSKSYARMIQNIQKSDMRLRTLPAVLCYIVMVLGLYFFVIKDKKPVVDAFVLGFIIYAVFNTTNLALIKNWNWTNSTIDTIWGGVLFAFVTNCYYIITNNI